MTALQYLRSIEWRRFARWDLCSHCPAKVPINMKPEDRGHAIDCPLAAAIADAEELEKRRGLRTREEVEGKLTNYFAADGFGGPRSALRWVLGEMK